jgi:hypothetical protein
MIHPMGWEGRNIRFAARVLVLFLPSARFRTIPPLYNIATSPVAILQTVHPKKSPKDIRHAKISNETAYIPKKGPQSKRTKGKENRRSAEEEEG